MKDYTTEIMLQDTYQTPADTKRAVGDILFFGTRIWGHMGILRIVFRCAGQIRRGEVTQQIFAGHGVHILHIIEQCQGKVYLSGMDNISAVNGPVVFIGNHMSLLETMLLPGIILPRRNMTFVIKQSLADLPVFGLIMNAMNCITVGRESPKTDFKKVIDDGIDRLQHNQSVVIFPQSTRSTDFNPFNFNTIGIKLARAAGVPVIPLTLKTDFLANGRYLKDFGPFKRHKSIHFHFGNPIRIEGTGKEQHNAIIAFIQENLSKWKEADGLQ